jgi:hypothetical protein
LRDLSHLDTLPLSQLLNTVNDGSMGILVLAAQ